MKFLDKRTNEIKTAHSIVTENNKVLVTFKEGGKAYPFNVNNVEIISETSLPDTNDVEFPHRIYHFERECHKCKKNTTIYTYIIFDDGTDEDVTFPWDKERLLEFQDLECHLMMPSLEFYGLKTLGRDENLDKIMLQKFPNQIKKRYSNVQKRKYPMNLCQHCGAKQGDFYVYEMVNKKIAKMENIDFLPES